MTKMDNLPIFVKKLLSGCDTLEAQLHQTRTLGAHLLASTLHHLLAA
jgi:hypothetical protein